VACRFFKKVLKMVPENQKKVNQAANGGIAMAIAIVATWGLGEAGVDVPGEITAAVSVIVGWIFARYVK